MKVIGVIPARYESTRFPGKPLAEIFGKPMIQWVYEASGKSSRLSGLIVATDDERIYKSVVSFGGSVVMTSKNCFSGTDRVAEAVRDISADIIINIQGDEPLLDYKALDFLVELFAADMNLKLATLVAPIKNREELSNSNVVKVVMDNSDNCLYFSRSAIPFTRALEFNQIEFWRHVGIYAFEKDFLFKFTSYPQGNLEKAESLEQLRALENNVAIKAVKLKEWKGISIDTPQDLLAIKDIIKMGG